MYPHSTKSVSGQVEIFTRKNLRVRWAVSRTSTMDRVRTMIIIIVIYLYVSTRTCDGGRSGTGLLFISRPFYDRRVCAHDSVIIPSSPFDPRRDRRIGATAVQAVSRKNDTRASARGWPTTGRKTAHVGGRFSRGCGGGFLSLRFAEIPNVFGGPRNVFFLPENWSTNSTLFKRNFRGAGRTCTAQ